MLEKTSSGLLYHPSCPSSPKVLPTSKTLDDRSTPNLYAHLKNFEVLEVIGGGCWSHGVLFEQSTFDFE